MAISDKESQEAKDIISNIDFLVYKAYELSYDDILIHNQDFTLTREEYENFNIDDVCLD